MTRKSAPAARIGVFGIGLAAYWPQFPGLKARLEGYQREVEAHLARFHAQIVSAGLVDTASAAREAGELFGREDVDLLVCYVGTYATSSQVLPVVQRTPVPVVVLNLQPVAALDYATVDTGEWLANQSARSLPLSGRRDRIQSDSAARRRGLWHQKSALRQRCGQPHN